MNKVDQVDISSRAREIARQFKSMGKPQVFDLEQERKNTKDAHVLTGVPRDVLMEWETVAGQRCIRMRPANATGEREVIFLHGGAYCLMSALTHHRFAGHIAKAVKADVLLPDYPLAPETQFPGARDTCMAVQKERRENGPKHQILAGDSAGAGLTLSLACALRDGGAALPDALILMSPWLDLTLSGTALQDGQIDDPILSIGNLSAMADMYRGDVAANDPGVSPLFADHSGLPPVLIQSAENDLLREDAERLAACWPDAGQVELQEYRGMLHSFQMFAGDMPEADQAIAACAPFLDRVL
jgi:acetyl esterase/lipase